jgi:hypothetical protein
MRVSLWRLLQDIIESVIAHVGQFEVTILDQIYQAGSIRAIRVPSVGPVPAEGEPFHSRFSVEVELTWTMSGSMSRIQRAVWSKLLTSEEVMTLAL